MKIINLFPIEFFEFQNSSINNQEIIKKLEDLPGLRKQGSVVSYLNPIHTNNEFKGLFDWINQCLEQIRVNLEYDCDQFEITNSWYNKAVAGRGMHQNYHKHTMSFFSGVYYLTEGSPTMFEDPVAQRSQAQIEILRKNYLPFENFEATPGKLLIFPSWIYHQTPPHIGSSDRVIISFNILPTGNINSAAGGGDSQCYISLKKND